MTDFLLAAEDLPLPLPGEDFAGLTALMNCGAIGEPRPVQGSHPVAAGKLPLLPVVMSWKAVLAFAV